MAYYLTRIHINKCPYIIFKNSNMKNKLAQKQQKVKQESSSSEEEIQEKEQSQSEQIKEEEISFLPKMLKKDCLYVTFNGLIETGIFDELKQVSLYYAITAGPDWKKVCGKRQGITQMASRRNQQIVWNYPFEITYETTVLAGWPQIIIIIYGTDFFGKSIVKGYSNHHLPSIAGKQTRKLRVFCPLPQSWISGIIGYFQEERPGQKRIAQYRDVQKTLGTGEGREVTRTKSVGQIQIKMQTTRYNFDKFGYE